jgi:tetratricopeptide (TPR) repeat protein
MMIRSRFIFLILLMAVWSNTHAAGYVFDYNSRCQQAYQAYTSLQINEGDELIRNEFADNPDNLMATYLADYGDFLSLMFRGSAAELKRRQPYYSKRLALLSKAGNDDPWKNFAIAGIHLHWAIIHGWYGDQFKAATTFRKSYLLLKENNRKFPSFPQNNILLGVEETVAGTIPDEYKWFASLFGMKGSVVAGVGRLKRFLDGHPPNTPLYDEAVIYHLYLNYYLLSRKEEVWKMVNGNTFPEKGNLLQYFIKANIALNHHKADIALQTLKEASLMQGYSQIPALDYEMGSALFHKLDAGCTFYFNRFLQANQGKVYSKDALMKSGLSYYLQGNKTKANECRQLIGSYGNTITDADKQAQRFSKEGNWPNLVLLQARILIDGGYNNQALTRLLQLDINTLPDIADKLEYHFRIGRAYEETADVQKAVFHYQQAINQGKDRKEQFAARSALQMGFIYEKHNQRNEALQYFRLCLSMKEHDFQASIDQQAKAGINRLSP